MRLRFYIVNKTISYSLSLKTILKTRKEFFAKVNSTPEQCEQTVHCALHGTKITALITRFLIIKDSLQDKFTNYQILLPNQTT